MAGRSLSRLGLLAVCALPLVGCGSHGPDEAAPRILVRGEAGQDEAVATSAFWQSADTDEPLAAKVIDRRTGEHAYQTPRELQADAASTRRYVVVPAPAP